MMHAYDADLAWPVEHADHHPNLIIGRSEQNQALKEKKRRAEKIRIRSYAYDPQPSRAAKAPSALFGGTADKLRRNEPKKIFKTFLS